MDVLKNAETLSVFELEECYLHVNGVECSLLCLPHLHVKNILPHLSKLRICLKMFLEFKQVLFSDLDRQIFKNGHISANRGKI